MRAVSWARFRSLAMIRSKLTFSMSAAVSRAWARPFSVRDTGAQPE